MKKKFVAAKKDIELKNNKIEKNDIGIIETESEDSATVFFVRKWKEVKVFKKNLEFIEIEKTGDGFEKKICNVCHKLLPTTSFARNQNGINNRIIRRPSCIDCRREIEGIDIPVKIKREWSKSKPNQEPFECPICHKRTIAGITCKIVLDHDHLNGRVRGWICDSCNTGIGRFKDDKKIVLRAIDYLENN